MKFYLSSYKFGNHPEQLAELFGKNKRVGYISNALDLPDVDSVRKKESEQKQIQRLRELGLEPEHLELKEYFENNAALQNKIEEIGGVWIHGGNTFILRQAMYLSGLDKVLQNMQRNDFVYAGFSAAGCVLSPRLEQLQIVDNPIVAYDNVEQVIWEGLGLIDVAFMPHWNSNHPESKDIDKEIALCKEKGIPYKPLRDGEVWIF